MLMSNISAFENESEGFKWQCIMFIKKKIRKFFAFPEKHEFLLTIILFGGDDICVKICWKSRIGHQQTPCFIIYLSILMKTAHLKVEN